MKVENLGCKAEIEVKNNLQKKQIELNGLKAKIIVKVKDENEKVVKVKEFPANSFLLNFMKMLYTVFIVGSIKAKDTKGNEVDMKMVRIKESKTYTVEFRTITRSYEQAGYHAWALKQDDSHGILIGTGTESVSVDDYTLSSKIPNGLEKGKMLYLESVISDVIVSGNSAYVKLTRSFLNYSGDTITINEVGLAVRQFSPKTDILIIRDLIEPIEVPNNYGVDVSYVIEVHI